MADHGSGVPRKDRENIFKRFWRGRGREGAKAPASASPSSAKPCERIAVVSASRTIPAAVPSSLSRFRLCKPETRRSPAGTSRETRHERWPQRTTAPLKPTRSNVTAIFQVLPSSSRDQAAKARAFAALRHAPIQGGEPTRHPAQSSSSSSLSARRRPVCESTAILLVSPFMEPVTSIYLPLREMATFDHPSVCNFSRTCSAVTGRSPAMRRGSRGLLRVCDRQANASGE